jgi:hypothetical protein
MGTKVRTGWLQGKGTKSEMAGCDGWARIPNRLVVMDGHEFRTGWL